MRNFIWHLHHLVLGAGLALAATTALSAESTSPSTSPSATPTVNIRGVLREKGTGIPLSNVNVFVLPHKIKATTDARGRFEVIGVPEGPFNWVVNFSGYRRLDEEDGQLASEPNAERSLYLEKQRYQSYEITVRGRAEKRDDTTRSLKPSEFLTLPGSGGDAVKAVQNLPGVQRAAAFNSQVIIQGSAPRDTSYMIDGHSVPIIFHFGGLSSVVMPEALERVDYLSAGYGPEYGYAMGGLVGVWTRQPDRSRTRGFAFVDIFNAGAQIEGPITPKSSFLLGVRQSYVGTVLRAVIPKDSDFNLTVAPSFTDLIGIYDAEVTPIDQFRLVTVGSLDRLEFLLKEPVGGDPSIRGNFNNKTAFFRIIPELTHRHGERTTSRWSFGIGRDWTRLDFGENYFVVADYSLTARAELERRLSSTWTSQWGMDHRFVWANVEVLVPNVYASGGVVNPIGSNGFRQADIRSTYQRLGFYWRNQIEFPDVALRPTVIPSIREEYYNSTHEFLTLPRLAARGKLTDSLTIRGAGGLYAQPPTEEQTDPTFGNTALKAPRAWHATAGIDKDFRQEGAPGFTLSEGAFYRSFERLVIPSTAVTQQNGVLVPENFNNNGTGRAVGLETLLKYETSPWTGWLSYTLSRSTRWNPQQGTYIFGYDQTHLLTAIGSVDLPNNWKISARFRYATGNPFTPIVGSVFDSDNDTYFPVRGAFYSERVEPFMQLDVRFDKKWIYQSWILSLYLDIQNATNRKNIETVQYSYDYSTRSKVSGLPILPTFGVRGEF